MGDILEFPRRHATSAVPADDQAAGSLHACAARLRADAEGVRRSMLDLENAIAELKALDLPAKARELALASADSKSDDAVVAGRTR